MVLVRRVPIGTIALLCLAAAQPGPLEAQPQKYAGLTITNIQFEPREQPLEAGERHDLLPARMGQPLRMGDVRASIERLFATGRYADIRVDAEPYRNGVALTFITKNRWFIGSVAIGEGTASPPTAGQLENAANLTLGELYTEGRLKQALADQQRLLESNGLFRARVVPQLDWDTGSEYQQVNLRFDVTPGPRARFATPVLTGDLKVDAERIIEATKFRRWILNSWKPMTQTRVRQALDGVRKLYEKDDRLEAKISLEGVRYEPESNSAIPTLRIEAGPRIHVNPIGAKIPDSRLRRLVPVFEEHAVDRDLLVEGARNLKNYLQSRGYFEAEVEFKQQAVIRDQANIDYLINTGPRHRLVHIEIAGNRYFSTDSIRERMLLQTANFLQYPRGHYSEEMLRRDREEIERLYQSNGFRDVKVTSRTDNSYQGKYGDLAVFLAIDEGPQYFVASLQVDGVEKLDRKKLLARLSSTSGQPFSETNIAVDRDFIRGQYFESGFPEATFEWNYKPASAPHQFDVRYIIREGRQQFVRQVLITGNKVTRSQLIDRNITLSPGDPLSPTEISEIQRRLYALGVFARVDAAVQNPEGEGDRKYVLYNVEEARRYSMAVGFGAELGRIGGCDACFEAPAGATGFAPRVSFDIARNNLWGLTHSLSLRTRASTLDQRALLNYVWPHFRDRDNLTVSFTGLYRQSRDVRTFNFRREEASAQLSQRLTKAMTLFYRYTYRRVGLSDLKVTPFLVPTLSQPVRLGIGQLNAVYDRRDDPLDPHKGLYTTVDFGFAQNFLGAQRNPGMPDEAPGTPTPTYSFMRFLVRNATYHQLSRRFVLARSTQFGAMHALRYPGSDLDVIPLPERFFGGGGTSDRGFPEYQAGPRDTSTGFPLGGAALFFNQTELRFPLIGDTIGGVLFHDMGNVYSGVDSISFRLHQRNLQDFDYMVHAAGFGLHYRTPVGPLRVDLAYSINPPYFYGFNGTQQELINAGVNPCVNAPNLCSQQNVSHFQFFFSLGQTF